MEYANRSQEFSAEFDDEGTMTFMIDGKVVTKLPPWQKATRKSLTGKFWEVTPAKNKWEICGDSFKETPVLNHLNERVVVHKNGNKEFFKEYGVTSKQVFPVINAIQYKMAILPYKDYFKLFKTNNSINPTKYRDVINSFELLEQARKDGIMNITPFIAAEGKSPQELKKKYGKALWKKLCGNTFNRNLAISRIYYIDGRGVGGEAFLKRFEKLSDIDTTALFLRYGAVPEISHWIRNKKIVKYVDMNPHGKDREEYLKWNNIVRDTRRMAAELGLHFTFNWSSRKMKEKHDEYARMYGERQDILRRERDEKYRKEMEEIEKIDLSDIYPVLEWTHEGVNAKILTTYKQIRTEGDVQGHCVGSYGVHAMEMAYAVVHLESESEKTTLGLNVSEVIKEGELEYIFFFNQHYGVYNQPVKSQKHRELQEIIIKSLNSAKIKVKTIKVNIQAKLV